MNPQKQELLDKLKGAQNILVTVSANPSVDQLAACIGMTLLLNKLKKHATAVFSGAVPSTIEFLKPEETLEKNTDSLRDFIISLDKSKADKLRYKVEDQVVRIFITPYKTSISQNDLEFSQGDFNVDVVLCLGVSKQEDLDQAITMHGRILHDAVVLSVNTQSGGEVGSINWTDTGASSLAELVASLTEGLSKGLLDGQIATALLTGIVAETDRFSNEKTSPETMRLSAELMAAGANQQLVATELETPPEPPIDDHPADSEEQTGPDETPSDTPSTDGTLEISHPATAEPADTIELPEPKEAAEGPDEPPDDSPAADEASLDDILNNLQPQTDAPAPAAPAADQPAPAASDEAHTPSSRIILQPPALGGTLTANTTPEDESLSDPLSTKPEGGAPILDHAPVSSRADDTPPAASVEAPDVQPPSEPAAPSEPVAAPASPPADDADQIKIDAQGNLQVPGVGASPTSPLASTGTLSDLEAAVDSPHAADGTQTQPADAPDQDVSAARNAVTTAINSAPPTTPLPPTAASGATGYLPVQPPAPVAGDDTTVVVPDLTEAAANEPANQPAAGSLPLPTPVPDPVTPPPAAADDNAPPPVPPPLPLSDLSKFMTPPNP